VVHTIVGGVRLVGAGGGGGAGGAGGETGGGAVVRRWVSAPRTCAEIAHERRQDPVRHRDGRPRRRCWRATALRHERVTRSRTYSRPWRARTPIQYLRPAWSVTAWTRTVAHRPALADRVEPEVSSDAGRPDLLE
jgi:hypothetical protein